MSNVIEEISKRSREDILNKVACGYKESDFCRKETQNPVVHIKTTDNPLNDMITRMTENKYIVEQCSKDQLEETINKIVASYQLNSMMYPSDIDGVIDINKIQASSKLCFDKPIEDIRHEVFHTDFSIIQARAGVASHGVCLVTSSDKQPRMLSLAPTLCIMLLKKEDVVPSLVDALHLVKKEHPDCLPTNILFIAGPSRTSDIELVTVFGVHGSQKVHVIIY